MCVCVKSGQRVLTIFIKDLVCAPINVQFPLQSPNIIFPDADLDGAVAGALISQFFNQGQVCCAGSRYVSPPAKSGDVALEVNRFAKGVNAMFGGPMAGQLKFLQVMPKLSFFCAGSTFCKGKLESDDSEWPEMTSASPKGHLLEVSEPIQK